MNELRRFLSLFDTLVEHTLKYLSRSDVAQYEIVPVDTPLMFLGTRVNKINIGALLRHLILAEHHWFTSLPEVEPGGTIPFPKNAAALDEVPDGPELLQKYRDSYAEARRSLEKLTAHDLEKEVTFGKTRYNGLGLLWTILGHHSFHLGQIDLLQRQQNIEPPEYMEWPTHEVLG